MYIRNCPSCKKEIFYKGKQAYYSAEKKNICCISCAKAGNKKSIKNSPEKWIRICDECKSIRKYKSYRAWFNSKNIKYCVSCAQKNHVGHLHTEEHKEYMSKLMTGRVVTWKDKISASHWSKNKELRKKIIENHSAHMAELIAQGKLLPHKNRGFKYGSYVKKSGEIEYYRSSYELERMIQLDNDSSVINWTVKHGIRIPYTINGIKKNYLPDFLIEYANGRIVLEEVKGYIKDKEIHQKKVEAASVWVEQKNYEYVINFMR